jgi:hypothetical protein
VTPPPPGGRRLDAEHRMIFRAVQDRDPAAARAVSSDGAWSA